MYAELFWSAGKEPELIGDWTGHTNAFCLESGMRYEVGWAIGYKYIVIQYYLLAWSTIDRGLQNLNIRKENISV